VVWWYSGFDRETLKAESRVFPCGTCLNQTQSDVAVAIQTLHRWAIVLAVYRSDGCVSSARLISALYVPEVDGRELQEATSIEYMGCTGLGTQG